MLPLDLTQVLRAALAKERRPPDGKLHASSHLLGSLRHVQLDVLGAPTIERDLVADTNLKVGTLVHDWFHQVLMGQPFMAEVKLDTWLPEGWSGTADWVFFDPERKAFVLGDLKTIKGEGLAWIERGGAKDEHLWQLSAYWYALKNMGLQLVEGFAVFYLPKQPVAGQKIMPSLQECTMLDEDLVLARMAERHAAVESYRASITPSGEWDSWLSDELAPVQPRVQKMLWSAKAGAFEVKLAPHWSAAYCPFPNELCDCSEQGTTKVGEFDLDGTYHPRKGYDEIMPVVYPTDADIKRRRKEQ